MIQSDTQILEEIKRLYRKDPSMARSAIESYLEDAFSEVPLAERIYRLEQLISGFKPDRASATASGESTDEVLSRVFSLLLGKKVTHDDLTSEELLDRLAGSLNTIFDSLNQLVEVINSSLYGKYDGEQTIRQVIGIHMIGQNRGTSLEEYLGQIRKAFLVAQKGFRESIRVMVERILTELDPEKFGENSGGGFKFGPLKKAEYFGLYRDEYQKVRKWFDSERYLDDFQKEFEKACGKLLT